MEEVFKSMNLFLLYSITK